MIILASLCIFYGFWSICSIYTIFKQPRDIFVSDEIKSYAYNPITCHRPRTLFTNMWIWATAIGSFLWILTLLF